MSKNQPKIKFFNLHPKGHRFEPYTAHSPAPHLQVVSGISENYRQLELDLKAAGFSRKAVLTIISI